MKKLFLKTLMTALVLLAGGVNAVWSQTTWTFLNNTAVWGGVTLNGGAQYGASANAVTTGGVTFIGTNGFVATAKGIGFNAVGSKTDENISLVVPKGYIASVSIYTTSNRTVVGSCGGETWTFKANNASSTYNFDNSEGTEDVTLYLYCNQNPGGSDESKAPFLEKIELIDMSTVSFYPWSAKAVANINGTETTIKTYNSDADVMEGSEYTVVVDKLINYGGDFYALNDEQFAENVFGATFTMGAAAAEYEFNYEKVENVAFYGEAEDIYTSGVRANKSGASVLSNGGGYYAAGAEGHVTLTFNVPKTGIYNLALGMNNTDGKGRGFNYAIDNADVSETITVGAGKAFVQTIEDQPLEAGDHTITLNLTYSLTPVFDYLLITKCFDPNDLLVNADFSSTDGWTKYVSGSFNDVGNGKIGDYTVRFSPATVDETHLATEYCLGFECRWNGNYASYNQETTSELPEGAYTLFFDVENVNGSTTKASYDNLFYVQVGETKYTDNSTEWMNGKSGWTKHSIDFTLTEPSKVTVSFGYGTGSNNISADNTPALYVSHLQLASVFDLAKAALREEIAKAKLCDGKEDLSEAIAAAEGVLATATTKEELEEALADLQAADKDAVLRYENDLADAAALTPIVTGFVVNGNIEDGKNGWTCTGGFQNQNPKTGSDNNAGNMNNSLPWWENWNPSAKVNKMYQTIENIPNGTYKMKMTAFVNNLNASNQYIFANSDQTSLDEKALSGADYEVWTVVTENVIEIGLEQTEATANWMGLDNVTLTYYGAGDVISDAQAGAHKADWLAALAAAQAALDNEAYVNVIGTEKTDLEAEIAKAEPTTDDGYDEATEALNTATATFIAAKGAYDLYAEYKDVELPYAAESAKPEINEWTTAEVIVSLLRGYYESNAKAEGVWPGGTDYTDRLTNYVDPENVTGWTVKNTTGNSKMRVNGGQSYTGVDELSNHTYFDSDSWGSAFAATFTQDVELPQGVYILTAKARGNGTTTYKVIADDKSTDVTPIGNTGGVFGRGWNDYTVEFEVFADKTVTLGIQMETGNSANWLSFSDFRLYRIGDSETGNIIAEANELAADNDAVAVGKLREAIAVYEEDGNIETLAAAVEQFKKDNADTEKDVTSKVGTDKESWTVGTGNGSNRGTYTQNGITLVEHYGESDAGVMISQEVSVENGIYNIELYATSHNAWNNFGASLQEDADDVAYVFGTSGDNTVKTWITARKNGGMIDSEPEAYAIDGLEVTDEMITMGLALDKSGQTEWHTIQIKKLALVTAAKEVYALDKAEMSELITEAEAQAAIEYKTKGQEELDAAIDAAVAALDNNKLNIAEFEAEIQKLRAAVNAFNRANMVAEGSYYVQNVASDKFMAAGHDWGTRGIVNETGLDLTIAFNEDNKVTFDTQVYNGDEHFMGVPEAPSIYMDSPTYAWTLEQVSEDEYTIGNGSQYIGVDVDDNLALVDEAVTWKFVAFDDLMANRLATLSSATADSPEDATFLLKNPNFNRNDRRVTQWDISEDCNKWNLNGGNSLNNCAESYHSTFTISQTVEGAPAGVYQMTAQGFYRQDDGEIEDAPLFFAGVNAAEVPVMGELPDYDDNKMNSMGDASVEFTSGLYTIDPIEFIVGDDGVLTVGIKNEKATHQWIIFDNFQLTYFGPAPKTPVPMVITEEALYATFCAPFDVTIPADVKAYTVDNVDPETNELEMTLLETTIPANTPVVLNSTVEVNTTVEGVAQPVEYPSAGLLIGVYDDTPVIPGTYVLQKQDGVAFFLVGESSETPDIPAYHAYLTTEGDGARAYYFGGNATAISAIQALTAGDAQIFDVNGRRQVKLQKGVNIIRTKDGQTRKVMVK